MAMEKCGRARRFVCAIRRPAQPGRSTRATELTPLQTTMMATQPDMIADYARHLADAARRAGHADVEVRADVSCR